MSGTQVGGSGMEGQHEYMGAFTVLFLPLVRKDRRILIQYLITIIRVSLRTDL